MEETTTFEVDDKSYELAQVDDLTFREARLLKTYTDKTGIDLVNALMAADPDVWFGVMLISMMRARGERTPVEVVEGELEQINFMQTVSGFFTEEEEDDEVPPPESPASADELSGPPPTETPDTGGHPQSETVSA